MALRIVAFAAVFLSAFGRAGAQNKSLLADALDWYAVWGSTNELRQTTQVCRGENQGGIYALRCEPMSVVIAASFDNSGRCSINNMRTSAYPEDGFHVMGGRVDTSSQRRKCGELPLANGTFRITIKPHHREIDESLTARARDSALAYVHRTSMRVCTVYFPKVKEGDPFFDIYEQCDGMLESIREFTIQDGEVATSPHWTYTRKGDTLQVGAGWRLNRPDLWFDRYRPGREPQ
jgi:hypothetical protein